MEFGIVVISNRLSHGVISIWPISVRELMRWLTHNSLRYLNQTSNKWCFINGTGESKSSVSNRWLRYPCQIAIRWLDLLSNVDQHTVTYTEILILFQGTKLIWKRLSCNTMRHYMLVFVMGSAHIDWILQYVSPVLPMLCCREIMNWKSAPKIRYINDGIYISVTYCERSANPLLTDWSYVSFASTHWGRDKMVAISKRFSNAFSNFPLNNLPIKPSMYTFIVFRIIAWFVFHTYIYIYIYIYIYGLLGVCISSEVCLNSGIRWGYEFILDIVCE